MRIMLTGASGQVGWELARSLLPIGKVIALNRDQCDLARPETLPSIVEDVNPDVIINAAAYTTVDKAEDEEGIASLINCTSVGVLSEEAKKRNALFVHYSTDYVFDGTKQTPYTEEDRTNPVNAYGRSKLAGEVAVQQTGCDYLIVRTAWVFSAHGKNFLTNILRLTQERSELNIVSDQTGDPTWARFVAEATAHCVKSSLLSMKEQNFQSQIYNLTSDGNVSWYDFAKCIVASFYNHSNKGKSRCSISPIKTDEYKTRAKRPGNSCLSTKKIEKDFNLVMPSWEQTVQMCIEEVLQA